MKAKFYKVNKFMWSVIEIHMEGEDGYRIQSSLGILPVNLKPFGNLGKTVKKHLVRGDGKCIYSVLSNKEESYEVFMFAKTTSKDEFIAYEHKIADLILNKNLPEMKL